MSESHLPDNAAQSGAMADLHVQDLLRRNQDLQGRLASAERELEDLRRCHQQLQARHEDYRLWVRHLARALNPPESWENLDLENAIPIEDIFAEVENQS